MAGEVIHTVQGVVESSTLGLILPHEHLFTDLRGPLVEGYARADLDHVVEVMLPYLETAYKNGVTALVECSTVGVGRNMAVLKKLASLTPIYIVAPTGVYREAYFPEAYHRISKEDLASTWINDLCYGIEDTTIRAGFIKIAMSDDGPKPLEIRNLEAAAVASRKTGAAIASHTIGGELAIKELDILERAGADLNRFIWVHANAENEPGYHITATQRGAYVEFDFIGSSKEADEQILQQVKNCLAAGYLHKILLSHDAGWYDPSQANGQPDGGGIRGYNALCEDFIPRMRLAGISEEEIKTITHLNPAQAFSIDAS